LRNEGFGRRGKESGFGVQGSAIRVQSSGFRVQEKKEKDSDNREPLAPEPRTPNPCILAPNPG